MKLRARVGRLLGMALVLLWARTSLAGASARLVYVRGSGAGDCPSETAIRAAVRARLGYDPFFAWAHDTMYVEASRSEGTIRVQVKLVGEDNSLRGARDLSVKQPDCASVVDAMALSISLAIDPNSVLGGASAPATSAGSPSAEPTPAPAPPPPAAPAPPAPPAPTKPNADAVVPERAVDRADASGAATVHVRVGADAAGWFGAAAGTVNAGGEAFAGVRWRAASLDVEGRADLPATGPAERLGVRVRSSILAVSIVPCWHLGPLFGCAVASAGSQSVTSVGVETPQSSSGRWAGVGARVGAELQVSAALSIGIHADVLRQVTNRVEVNDVAPAVYTFPPIAGGLALGLSWWIR
jgi:hypothetical protein